MLEPPTLKAWWRKGIPKKAEDYIQEEFVSPDFWTSKFFTGGQIREWDHLDRGGEVLVEPSLEMVSHGGPSFFLPMRVRRQKDSDLSKDTWMVGSRARTKPSLLV